MLIPQQCAKGTSEQKSKYSAGHYIALNVTITATGGQEIYKDWAYVGIDTKWEQGKHYTYTLDFSKGAGQKEDGTPIISGSEIEINTVTVTPISDGDTSTTNMSGVES